MSSSAGTETRDHATLLVERSMRGVKCNALEKECKNNQLPPKPVLGLEFEIAVLFPPSPPKALDISL